MKTMKVVLAAAMLFAATMSAHAQFSKKENNREPDRFHMGIRGGFTSNTVSGSDMSGASISPFIFPTGGFALDFQVAPVPLFVGLGVNYMNYGFDVDNYKKFDDYHSIQVPLTVSYHINVAPNLFINPFIGEFSAYNFETETFNYGLRLGVGMNFGRLTLDLGYDFGLTNIDMVKEKHSYYYNGYAIHDDYSSKGKTGTFFMTIGFNWAGSR